MSVVKAGKRKTEDSKFEVHIMCVSPLALSPLALS